MKLLKLLLFSVLLFSITGCTVYGLTSDYKKLSDEEKKHIHSFSNFQDTKPKEIYKINGLQLKEELKKNEKSMVYLFVNGCTSKYCKPMRAYEDYAEENGYHLYLVMVGYGFLNKTLVQDFTAPLFSIDNDYYETSYREKYSRKFENQLLGKPIDAKQGEWKGDIYIFHQDKLVEIKTDID